MRGPRSPPSAPGVDPGLMGPGERGGEAGRPGAGGQGVAREGRAVKKVIVIGLDGLEPKIVETMLAAGELPNLEALGRLGGRSRVATTSPAQTPVAWSTFATGTNPGGHGIFDFI